MPAAIIGASMHAFALDGNMKRFVSATFLFLIIAVLALSGCK
jgi:hypothetical protein